MSYAVTQSDTTVLEMAKLDITGNILHPAWSKNLRRNGKPHYVAVLILAEIVYWYRPVQVRDPHSNAVTLRKKFKGDKLQLSTKDFSERIGTGRRCTQEAMAYLKEIGLITVELRSQPPGVSGNGKPHSWLANSSFIDINMKKLIEVTHDYQIEKEETYEYDNTDRASVYEDYFASLDMTYPDESKWPDDEFSPSKTPNLEKPELQTLPIEAKTMSAKPRTHEYTDMGELERTHKKQGKNDLCVRGNARMSALERMTYTEITDTKNTESLTRAPIKNSQKKEISAYPTKNAEHVKKMQSQTGEGGIQQTFVNQLSESFSIREEIPTVKVNNLAAQIEFSPPIVKNDAIGQVILPAIPDIRPPEIPAQSTRTFVNAPQSPSNSPRSPILLPDKVIPERKIQPDALDFIGGEVDISTLSPHKQRAAAAMNRFYARTRAETEQGISPHIDLGFVREELRPLAKAFTDKFGRGPAQRERLDWARSVGEQHDFRLEPSDITEAFEKMRKEGLTISRPGSVTAIAYDLKSRRSDPTLQDEPRKSAHSAATWQGGERLDR